MHRASGEPFYRHLDLLGRLHILYKIIKRSGEFYTHWFQMTCVEKTLARMSGFV